jgi:hypothetical protein
VPIGDLARESPVLKQLAALEGNGSELSGTGRAMHLLYRGDVAGALAEGAIDDPGLLVLVAASDGAPGVLVARVLGEAPDKLPPMYALYAGALARRLGRGPEPYRARFATAFKEQAARIDAFFSALESDPRSAEAAIDSLQFDLRAHLLAAGTVQLGAKAPGRWREIAKLGLFPGERPYFQ